MSDAERDLAFRITKEIALAVVQGEANPFKTLLAKYGDYGFELVEEFCQATKEPG